MNNRIDDIEVLRGFAVLLVIVEHMQINLFTWGTPILNRLFTYLGGWTGVDLFFAISGFVIARSLLPQLLGEENRETYLRNVVAFWIRRFWRLTPSAWTWLGLIAIATFFFNETGVWGTLQQNYQTIISAVLHVANLHMAMIFGTEPSGAAFVYWSLSLEEQFYIVLPFIVLFSKRWLPWVLGAIVVIQLVTVRDTLHTVMLRTDALFLGVLIALWSGKESYRLFEPHFLNHRLVAFGVFAILLTALATIGSDELKVLHHRFGVVAVLSAALVLFASYNKDYLFRNRLLKSIFIWIGSRSYALYLTHIPSYLSTREIWHRIEPPGTRFGPEYTFKFFLTAILLMILFSELNYRFIETPFRKKGARIASEFRNREL